MLDEPQPSGRREHRRIEDCWPRRPRDRDGPTSALLQRVATPFWSSTGATPVGCSASPATTPPTCGQGRDQARAERREVVLRKTPAAQTEGCSGRRGAPAPSRRRASSARRRWRARLPSSALAPPARRHAGLRGARAAPAAPHRGARHQQEYDARAISATSTCSWAGVRSVAGARCGKSTLIRVLLVEEPPSTGNVTRADDLQFLTSRRAATRWIPRSTVANTSAPTATSSRLRARACTCAATRAVLFSAEQADLQVGKLSAASRAAVAGGAHARPAQVLVLDEPTNDLDLATLTCWRSRSPIPGAV